MSGHNMANKFFRPSHIWNWAGWRESARALVSFARVYAVSLVLSAIGRDQIAQEWYVVRKR